MDQTSWAGGLKQFWAGLPVWGRVLVFVAPLLVLIGIIAAITGLTGHSESWEYGYRHANDAAKTVAMGVSGGSSCRGVAGLATEYVDSNFVYSEVVEGCLAGLKDRNG